MHCSAVQQAELGAVWVLAHCAQDGAAVQWQLQHRCSLQQPTAHLLLLLLLHLRQTLLLVTSLLAQPQQQWQQQQQQVVMQLTGRRMHLLVVPRQIQIRLQRGLLLL